MKGHVRNAAAVLVFGALLSLSAYACDDSDEAPRLVTPAAPTDASTDDSAPPAEAGAGYVIGPDPCGCASTERCIDGTCHYVPTALVALGITTARDVDAAQQAPSRNEVCFYRQVGSTSPTTTSDPIAADGGDCRVYAQDGGEPPTTSQELIEADIGTVTVTGAAAGANTFKSGDGSCLKSSLTGKLPFTGGETLSVEATGGDDFPGFALSVVAPEPLVVTTGTPKKGAPLVITWTGSGDGVLDLTVTTVKGNQSAFVTCRVKDSGSFTVPTTATDHLFDKPTGTLVHAERVVDQVARPNDKMVNMAVRLTAADSL